MAAYLPVDLPAGHEPLRRWEGKVLVALFVLLVAFCALVVDRSVFQVPRRTDASVYFRASWALRSGEKLYEVADDNGLHYAYPPLTAILLMPFADAPPGAAREWMLPYAWSLGLWIMLSVAATFLAVHWFAGGLEECATDPALRTPPPRSRRWWANRLLPLVVCVAPIGCTYSRGQITPFLLLTIAGMFVASVRGHSFRSGLWLSAAICLKVIPGLLLLYPLLRRDWKALAGVAAGGIIGSAVIPALALGPKEAVEINRQFVDSVIKPGLNLGGTGTLFEEMMSMKRPGCQSIKAIIHNYQNWDPATRPDKPNTATMLAYYTASALLVGGLVLAFVWRRRDDAVGVLTMLGALLTVMILISPESHTHYFCMPMPLVMALAYGSLEGTPRRLLPVPGTLAILAVAGFCYAIVMVEFWSRRREAGIPLYASLILLVAAVLQLRRKKPAVATPRARGVPLARVA
ncbi:MAG TPA: glycosyltransferase family 87 protein [Gemmataceae bacterium]|jgi:alpha-1,2-mannosyltransferase|nr:glycosyltransferase family 87 protein [Gemmataceae bacterium]